MKTETDAVRFLYLSVDCAKKIDDEMVLYQIKLYREALTLINIEKCVQQSYATTQHGAGKQTVTMVMVTHLPLVEATWRDQKIQVTVPL